MALMTFVSWLGCILLLIALELIARKCIQGFFLALLAELLWIIWGYETKAYALVAMSVAICAMYVRAIMAWRKSA